MPRASAISDLTERVAAYLTDCRVDAYAAHHVALVLDELLTNAATHGGAGAPRSERVTGEVVDSGKPFDPSLEREIDLSAHERPAGGSGLLLVRR
jgi:anti-sigma regulatory factor (Ser/Thr protein kinase)